jgi:hypothetical protein
MPVSLFARHRLCKSDLRRELTLLFIHLFSTAWANWCLAWKGVKSVNCLTHMRQLFTLSNSNVAQTGLLGATRSCPTNWVLLTSKAPCGGSDPSPTHPHTFTLGAKLIRPRPHKADFMGKPSCFGIVLTPETDWNHKPWRHRPTPRSLTLYAHAHLFFLFIFLLDFCSRSSAPYGPGMCTTVFLQLPSHCRAVKQQWQDTGHKSLYCGVYLLS